MDGGRIRTCTMFSVAVVLTLHSSTSSQGKLAIRKLVSRTGRYSGLLDYKMQLTSFPVVTAQSAFLLRVCFPRRLLINWSGSRDSNPHVVCLEGRCLTVWPDPQFFNQPSGPLPSSAESPCTSRALASCRRRGLSSRGDSLRVCAGVVC